MNSEKKKLVVIALGGNAIKQAHEKGTAEEQFKNVEITCEQLVKMNALGYKLIITHGNGPQAGTLLIQQEEGKELVPAMPMDIYANGYCRCNDTRSDRLYVPKHITELLHAEREKYSNYNCSNSGVG